MDQNEWENARVSMDFKLLAHHYMDLDHPIVGRYKAILALPGRYSLFHPFFITLFITKGGQLSWK